MESEDFGFPQGFIAPAHSLRQRGNCRLMIVQRSTGAIVNGMIEDFMEFDHASIWANNSYNSKLSKEFHPVYAKNPGSHATPSAGLFFTEEMVENMNVDLLTLHIGSPSEQPDIRDGYATNIGWNESYDIPYKPTAKITAIGTTVVKAMETMMRTGAYNGKSNLFIQPPFEFKIVNKFLTNFHFAGECLLALTCAFGGLSLVKEAYTKAVERNYLFGDYGDRLLII